MKNFTFLIAIFISFASNAQVDGLTSANWRLTGVTINSETIFPPTPNDEVESIFLNMKQEEPGIADFSTIVCNELTSADGVVIYDEANSTFTLPELTQTLISCNLNENAIIEAIYFNFFNDNLSTPFTFSVIELGDTEVLDIVASNGDMAHYQKGTLGTQTGNTISFTIYPNPVNNTLSVNTEDSIEQITIYSIIGETVSSYKTETIDTSILTAGIYFIEVQSNGMKSVQKFIKQ
jgi:hypothetical protein